MIKYMDKVTFKEHLLQVLNEISISQNVRLGENCKFTVVPIIEHGKSLNSTDEYLHRGMLNEKNLSGRELDFEAVVNMLACRIPLCPIWINVALKEIREEVPIIELQTSLRFRSPSLLQNQDTGHPPFKAIISTES
ncbi:hypothetical protein [Paenibacillus azoreducens]|uniref:Uncharacterized protein n=1 Tax=Paenibacillus azoreducens TaxID=116718 RepID=A0A920CRZ1_9BACL|nr:hypothetical protein [Paenibacillus azoreducens]GIO46903.1 hypothetical protein J34TS1_16680 [Paenibacillus azoreducens]